MMAIAWDDVDLHKRQLCVQRSEWKGHLTTTKGGRLRYVPMTGRLAAALHAHRHLRGKRVLVRSTGEPLTQKIVQTRVARAARVAGVRPGRAYSSAHVLFASRHARGSGAAIQELAGHQDLTTDPTVHAPQPGGHRGGHSAPRCVENEPGMWQHAGNGIDRVR